MEREGLSSTLDESADRIVMLEKEARERDCLVREHHSQTRSQVLIRDQMKVTDGAGHEAGLGRPHNDNLVLQIRNIKKESDELKAQNMTLNDRLDSVYRR